MPRPKRIPRGSFIDLGYFEAPGLGPARRVRAYAPHGHVHSLPRPALWMFDGQNVFEDEGSFSGGWYAHETLDRFAVLKKPVAPVLVAIDHGGVGRIDELTPFPDQTRPELPADPTRPEQPGDAKKGGRADEFLSWMVESLMPLVRRSVGLREEPEVNIVGGSSLGGLAAFYAHLKYPHAFGGAMSMSASFWFGKRRIFEFAEAAPIPWTSRVYLDGGVREARGMMFRHGKEMSDLLLRRGWPADNVMWRPDSKGTHSEKHWRRRLPKALRFLFR